MIQASLRVAGLAVFLGFSVSGAAAAAQAETIEQTLGAFGFSGRWSVNCEEPASPANSIRQIYISASGEAGFVENIGVENQQNEYRILEVRREGGDRIVMRIELNGKIEQTLTMMREGERMRTMANQRGDGAFVVRDGTVLGNGRKTPWLTRCSKTE